MLRLNALLINRYQSNEYVNKETKAVTPSKYKLQLLVETPMRNGSIRKELIDLTVKEAVYHQHKDSIGKTIEVDVGYFGNCTFYGV